jgi:hypothetical protein
MLVSANVLPLLAAYLAGESELSIIDQLHEIAEEHGGTCLADLHGTVTLTI